MISPADFIALRPRVAVFDARGGADAAARFEACHLEGARRVDVDRDLSHPGADASRGGRHPLPPAHVFRSTLGRLGVRPATHAVVYDDAGGAHAASRFWWMLRAAGHERVQVLDGGLSAAAGAGVPTAGGPGMGAKAPAYPFSAWPDDLVDADAYAVAASDPAQLAIDVRSPARFRGEEDPFDPNPGHVRGAVNVFYQENLDPDGCFRSATTLSEKYGALLGDREPTRIVVQCGSGITACHTLVALERAGLSGARLYVGSFSEWTRQGRPVEKGG